jgi:membrane-associated phospholipid phosphatase
VSAWSDHGMRRAKGPLLAAGLVIALAGLTADVLHGGYARRFDWLLQEPVRAHLHDTLPRMAGMALSRVGQPGIAVVPLLLLGALAARRHRNLRPVLVTAGVLLGTALLVLLFKAAIGRSAPSSGHDALHAGGSSYPSGHAVAAIVCWGLALEYAASLSDRAERALPRRRRTLLTAAAAVAAGAGVIALDYHWLSDVLAGWLLGTLILGLALAVRPVRGPGREPLSREAPRRRARRVPWG